MNFESVAITGGVLAIAAIVITHLSTKQKTALSNDMTRLEHKYFEPEILEAQKAEVESEKLKAAEKFLKL